MSRSTTALAVKAAVCATASVATLAACSSTRHPAVVVTTSYAPAAYGQNGQCYYLDDPQEALSLIAAGLCPTGWAPTLMPLAWHETYADYYASPGYYNTYAPVSYRSGWGNQWGPKSTFYIQNKTIIITKEKNATYKGSDGKTVPASAVPSAKLSFGAGVKPSISLGSVAPPAADNAPPSGKTSLGGGVKPVASAPKPPPASAPKPPAPVVPR